MASSLRTQSARPLPAADPWRNGYLPSDSDTANLFFQLIASRYEQGPILITSNIPFGRWGEVFADEIGAAALDRPPGSLRQSDHHERRLLPNQNTPRTGQNQQIARHYGVNFHRRRQLGSSHEDLPSGRPQARDRHLNSTKIGTNLRSRSG
nr:ATP-binding protein [Mycolicibacterium aubagnense]